MFNSISLKELGLFVLGALLALVCYQQITMPGANLATWMAALLNISVSIVIAFLVGRKASRLSLVVFTATFFLVEAIGYIPAMARSNNFRWTVGLTITLTAEILISLFGMGSVVLYRVLKERKPSGPKNPTKVTTGSNFKKIHRL